MTKTVNDPRARIILALDVPTVAEAREVIAETRGSVGVFKIGHQLLYAGGLGLAESLVGQGEKVFIDAKLHDIDNTVAHGVAALGRVGATFLTIHAYPRTMRAAVASKAANGVGTALLGVTVLTSMDDTDLTEAGYAGNVRGLVAIRAAQAKAAGMDGLVCSPEEAAHIRPLVGPDMALITPGVRPTGAASGDQKRVMTPGDAIRAGADYLVIGRPILAAPDKAAMASLIAGEIGAALDVR